MYVVPIASHGVRKFWSEWIFVKDSYNITQLGYSELAGDWRVDIYSKQTPPFPRIELFWGIRGF